MLHARSTLVLLITAFAAGGCSSSQVSQASPAGATPLPDGASNADGGAAPMGGATSPCNLHTSYAGDELCIAPPDPSVGFQLHYGPTNYDDPQEVAQYLLGPGQETTNCVFAKTPNGDDVFLNEYHARMRPGSHHMVLNAEPSAHADGFAACETSPTSRLLVGSSTAIKDFPDTAVSVPENDGLAMKIGATTQASIQLHYINTTDHPILREAWINFIYKDPSTVTTLADAAFLVAGTSYRVAPNTTAMGHGKCTAPADLRLVELHGHYHAHTVRATAWKVSGSQRDLIYESYDWHEPASLQYDSGHQNPAPDPDTKTAGGWNGDLEFKAGDSLEWECQVVNDGAATLTFTNAVYTGDMCIMSGNYAPSLNHTWSCVQP